MHRPSYRSFFVLLALGVVFFAGEEFSQVFAQATGADVSARRGELERELGTLEKEIEVQRKILAEKQRESVSLERDIAILDAQISKAKLSLRARTLSIRELEADITAKGRTVGSLSDKIVREQASLAQLLRKADEIKSSSLIEVVLANRSVSEFFEDIENFSTIQTELRDSIGIVRMDRERTEREKRELEEKKEEELDLKRIQELERKRLEQDEAEKQKIFKATKGKEKEYQAILKSKEKSAAAIRSELFVLQGTKAISFERALELANKALSKTGVRPAFLLGIIAEESNLGQNVGTGSWRTDMHPTRDQPVFELITAKLGLNPDQMPVSKKAWYGWGGAMGPAQFIPSTWVLYEDRVAALTGHNPPSPWDPEDAFMAAAIYLSDNGADKQTPAAERYAALCYLAGCKNAKKPAYAFYGDDVMALAVKYQRQIDILSGVAGR